MTVADSPHDQQNPYRFAPAASEEEVVYGASRPKRVGSGDPVDEWIDYMEENGIERVLCLLSDEQVTAFDRLLPRYRTAFGTANVRHTPLPDHELAPVQPLRDNILPFLMGAYCQDEPVVVHCWAGLGRTGQVLAAWLVYAHGYAPEAALETVANHQRVPDEAVQQGNGTRSELLRRLGSLT